MHFDKYVDMPNHTHLIDVLPEQQTPASIALSLGRIVSVLKSISANEYRKACLLGKLWQRSYYEHVIRNEDDYREI